jgi:outer membrane protein assembly factor BamB
VQQLGDLIVIQNRRGAVTALDPVTGAARWRTVVGLPYPVTQRVGYNDALILVANGTRIFALDRPTGKELWNVDLAGTPSSPPTADADAFYVCLSNGRLSAYAFPVESSPTPGTTPTTGTSAASGPKAPAAPAASGPAAAAGPGAGRTSAAPVRPAAAAGGGRTATVSTGTDTRSATTAVQVTGGRTAISASDVNRTGRGSAVAGGPRLLWDYQTNLRIAERPVVGEKNLLVVGTGREALFLDKLGGRPLVFTADAAFTAPVGKYGEIGYAACADGSVYAFHLATRVTLWQVTVNGAVTERPVVTDEDLFLTSERGGLTRFVRANGEVLWQNPAAVRFVASNPKFVYARDGAGRLLILDRGRGTTLTALDLREFTFSLPNSETDRLVLGADDGSMISLHDRAYPQQLRLRNPPAIVPPVAGAPATPDDAKPETPAEPAPKPRTPPAGPKPAPGAPATPPVPPAPAPPPPATPPAPPKD